VNFRIADSFTSSLARLGSQEQKAAKTTAFDLQVDPSHPGLKFHRIDRAKDPDFWTVRVNKDIRIVVHRRGQDMLLAYVDHHDDAYAWAERRRLDVHPHTGAAQIVEIRERVEDVVIPRQVEEAAEPTTQPVFAGLDVDRLLGLGVPEDWVDDVMAATEDSFLELAEHLPAEAAEALLNYAAGEPLPAPAAQPVADPYAHPDALRRFRVLENREALELALEYPWERWTVFLHPDQRGIVERHFSGPARVTGSAGTGKTVVALHRAVWLARQDEDARVLLTTFNEALANALRLKLQRLVSPGDPVRQRITVRSMRAAGEALHAEAIGPVEIAGEAEVGTALDAALAAQGDAFDPRFVRDEWHKVVDAWGVRDWETYRDLPRLGRKTRVGGSQREVLWQVFEDARARLAASGRITWPDLFHALAAHYADRAPPYTHAVVDEAQDISVGELRFLAAIAGDRADRLFFAGDIGQRIFRQPFSWKSVGVDIRGRSQMLRVNYRTSHQIRKAADILLPAAMADGDGAEEARRGVVSVFNGPSPVIATYDDREAETAAVADWLEAQLRAGVRPGEIGVIVRTVDQFPRAREAIEAAGQEPEILAGTAEPTATRIALCTMHVAKGLEFRAVAVIACDDEIVPLEARIATATDEGALRDVFNTERHLLYVACTRARDDLLVSGVEPVSEFVEDLRADAF
jgi:hypothetical protein